MTVMHSLDINLPTNSYPINIGRDLIRAEQLTPHIVGQQVLVVTNDKVAPLYLKRCLDALTDYQVETIVLPDGEIHKTIASWQQILETLLQHGHRRNTTLIALGGGVIGDMTGFAASCYQRGVAFIQIPTTLLAQVDSSIGGKTAVNHPLGKNMIGAFYQPRAVVIDLQTLSTLADDEFACGMAEVIKAAVIADPAFFDFLCEQHATILAKDMTALGFMIQRACEIKANIVEQDEKEAGIRALLNFGHTFGHAIETVMGYGQIKHGEAVAIGMMLATELAVSAGLAKPELLSALAKCLQYYQLPTALPAGLSGEALWNAMKLDKKNIDASIRFILPIKVGKLVITTEYKSETLRKILKIQ